MIIFNVCTEAKQKEKASSCQVTSCAVPDSSESLPDDICSDYLQSRWVNGKQLEYEEVAREECVDKQGNQGEEAVCCVKNSKNAYLTLILGAEKHQFPHYALVTIGKEKKGSHGICGGTIYNERYIITASHCMLHQGVVSPTKGSNVQLDVIMRASNSPNKYDVEEFIPHPNSTRWSKEENPPTLINDVGLIKLKKKIQFGPHIKALPIASSDFDPFKYADETILIGVGDTDTTVGSALLQRANVLLRRDEDNIPKYWPDFTTEDGAGVLFVGGMQHNTKSPRGGPGDSGGPGICRGPDGMALLCGMDSRGPDLATCEKHLNEKHCYPLAYMEAAHYHDWFVSVAGDQSRAEVLQTPLYGAPVPEGKYEHQIHITGKNGEKCGGTLIEKDVVVTAAHCVADDNGNKKDGLKVQTEVRDLNANSNGETFDVTNVKILDGFGLGVQGTRRRRIAHLNVKPTPKTPYYKNDLALLKLSGRADIRSRNLPAIGQAPISPDDDSADRWTTEVYLPLNTSRSGALQWREFKLLTSSNCQHRFKRASYANYDVKIDKNVMCGEERYNGGAQCDRELGGGLICTGDDGKDILCGVQVFRFCQLALPGAFLDLGQHKDWIEKTKASL